MFWFSVQLLSIKFFILRWIQRNIKICICLPVKCPLFLSDFHQTWIFSTDFRKIFELKLKIRPVRPELFHADGRTDRQTRRSYEALFVILWKTPRKTFHLLETLRMLLKQSAYKMKVMVKMTYEPRHTRVGSRGAAPPIPNVTIRWEWAVKFTLRTLWTSTTVLWIHWTGSWMHSTSGLDTTDRRSSSLPVQQIEPRILGEPSHSLVNDEKRMITLCAVTKRNIPKPLPAALDIWTTSNVKAMWKRTSFGAPHISVRIWGE